MYPSSDRFKTTIDMSHVMKVTCEVYEGIGLPKLADLVVVEGQVAVQDEDIRRKFETRVVDYTGDLTPGEARDLLTPFGHELQFHRGVVYPDGTEELLPIGRMEISDVTIDDSGENLQMRISGYDRGRKMARAKFREDYVVAAGTNGADAIADLLRSIAPDLDLNFGSTTYTFPRLVANVGDDPWKLARSWADSLGASLYFDPLGIPTLKRVAIPEVVDWEYSSGERAMPLYIARRLSNDEVYNYFIVIGEHTSNTLPVRADAFDDDPNSPTYFFGPFGESVAPPIKSKNITSVDQASEVAEAELAKSIGSAEQMDFLTLVNPGHEVGDFFLLVRPQSKVSAYYILDKASIPLTKDRGMNISGRLISRLTA